MSGKLIPHDEEFAFLTRRSAERCDFEAALDAAAEIDDPHRRAGMRATVVKRMAAARNFGQAREEAVKISDPCFRTLAHLAIARVTGSVADFSETLTAAEQVSASQRNALLHEIANSLAEAKCFLFARSVADKISNREKSNATRAIIDRARSRNRILGR